MEVDERMRQRPYQAFSRNKGKASRRSRMDQMFLAILRLLGLITEIERPAPVPSNVA